MCTTAWNDWHAHAANAYAAIMRSEYVSHVFCSFHCLWAPISTQHSTAAYDVRTITHNTRATFTSLALYSNVLETIKFRTCGTGTQNTAHTIIVMHRKSPATETRASPHFWDVCKVDRLDVCVCAVCTQNYHTGNERKLMVSFKQELWFN